MKLIEGFSVERNIDKSSFWSEGMSQIHQSHLSTFQVSPSVAPTHLRLSFFLSLPVGFLPEASVNMKLLEP